MSDAEEETNEEKFTNTDQVICVDDSTGKNVYFLNLLNQARTRIMPDNFQYEYFENNQRKYYFRGFCVRCRKKEYPSVISMKKQKIIFSILYCTKCILDTTPSVTTLRGYGTKIYEAHFDSPMMLYYNLTTQVDNIADRDALILKRSRDARYSIQCMAKQWRDKARWKVIREIAKGYQVYSGKYVSWGFDSRAYDEYFGEVKNNVPHGRGVKIYNDGTIYVGNFFHGLRQTTSSPGFLIKVIKTREYESEYEYEGQWLGVCILHNYSLYHI